MGLDNAGAVVKFFIDTGGVTHGFVLKGKWPGTTLDFPGTVETGINNHGEMVGVYTDSMGVMQGHAHGGRLANVDDPNGVVGSTVINGLTTRANSWAFTRMPTVTPSASSLLQYRNRLAYCLWALDSWWV